MKYGKIVFFIFLLSSCAKTETINLEEQSVEWLTGLDYDETFEMIDENNISQSWRLNAKDNYFNEGSSGILFFTTERTYRQMTYESFRSTVLGEFSLSVNADYSAGNDYISFVTDRMDISFTLKDLSVRDLYVDYSNGETNNWNYQYDEPLISKPMLVENIELKDKMYGETLIFKLEDFQNGLSGNDIIAFYFTKDEGLIYLELKSGLKYYRK